jgi:hypothetical protein
MKLITITVRVKRHARSVCPSPATVSHNKPKELEFDMDKARVVSHDAKYLQIKSHMIQL